jgi:hypothetical protein
MREEEKMDSRRYGTIWYVPYPYFEILNLSPNSHTRNEAKMNVELSPTILSPLYAKRAQKPDDANPMSS